MCNTKLLCPSLKRVTGQVKPSGCVTLSSLSTEDHETSYNSKLMQAAFQCGKNWKTVTITIKFTFYVNSWKSETLFWFKTTSINNLLKINEQNTKVMSRVLLSLYHGNKRLKNKSTFASNLPLNYFSQLI